MRRSILIILVLLLTVVLYRFMNPKEPRLEELPEDQVLSSTPTVEASAPVPPSEETSTVAPETPDTPPTPANPEQLRLRQEVKAALASGYTALKSFQAETERYTSDLKSAGWAPPMLIMEGKTGFLSSYQPEEFYFQENPAARDSDSFLEPYQYSERAQNIGLEGLREFCEQSCEVTNDTFEMISATNLDDDPDLDVWTINERKELKHKFDDLK